jgi:hypothetical protein
MLPEVGVALRDVIYEEGRIDPADVDVRFDAPTKEWIERLVRPTVNCFLYGVQENSELRQTGLQPSLVNGRAERRLPPRRIDLHYMVSAHATEKDDEHRLLWRVLATLMRFPELPDARLPEEARRLGMPLTMRIAREEDNAPILGLWGGLDVAPHPALCCVVTAPLDLDRAFDAPLVLTRTLRVGPSAGAEAHTDTQIGGVVRDGAGVPLGGVTVAIEGSAAAGVVTNAEGRFTFRHVPTGPLRLRALRPDGQTRVAAFSVPSESYDILLE